MRLSILLTQLKPGSHRSHIHTHTHTRRNDWTLLCVSAHRNCLLDITFAIMCAESAHIVRTTGATLRCKQCARDRRVGLGDARKTQTQTHTKMPFPKLPQKWRRPPLRVFSACACWRKKRHATRQRRAHIPSQTRQLSISCCVLSIRKNPRLARSFYPIIQLRVRRFLSSYLRHTPGSGQGFHGNVYTCISFIRICAYVHTNTLWDWRVCFVCGLCVSEFRFSHYTKLEHIHNTTYAYIVGSEERMKSAMCVCWRVRQGMINNDFLCCFLTHPWTYYILCLVKPNL